MFKLSEKVMVNEVENQGVIIMATDNEEKIFFLNDTCIDILKSIEKDPKSLDDIVDYIVALYDVDKTTCESDLKLILDDLHSKALVELV
ncbi:MAG TPA: hypothetical protein DHW61_03935 [Lachnoclostridium phytofermentans]|uniref:PqqD family protein n=1 Tax=Lachnoclostridium phytofermentans TaxID=66219 RepID=A0A3D2X3K1_9FIRM|nr:PqqD family protein [Lachnoclostridium sp.]HCL01556.1 hypothetical protein [Lachnoclostridium phytofermentans]